MSGTKEKLLAKTKQIGNKIKEFYIHICKTLNDIASGKEWYPFNFFAVYFIMAEAIVSPVIYGAEYFKIIWLAVCSEVVFAIFVIIYLPCILMYHRKCAWHWLNLIVLLFHYVILIGNCFNWDIKVGQFYLGVTITYFISYVSWTTAKDINRKGGIIDTVILAVGVFLLMVGAITKNGDYQHYKFLIIAGIALIYLYSLARTLLWLFFSEENKKINLIKTLLLTVYYIVLIAGVPVLLYYAELDDALIKQVIVPIYAAAVGGILTLAGVAWTIKNNANQRKYEEKAARKPYLILDETSVHEIADDNELYVITNPNGTLKTVFTQTEIFVTTNADCIFEGIIIANKYYNPSFKKYMRKGFWYLISELRLSQSIKTDKFYIVVKDLLGNYYKYECSVKEDIESNPDLYYNYVCYDIGLPFEITKEETLLIHSQKGENNK